MSIDVKQIEVKDLCFDFNGNQVFDKISFSIEKGDYVGIIGPNGGGKTTLLKILVGLLIPKSGTVKIRGTPINLFKDMYKMGYVPQRISQDNISFPATVYEVVESGRAIKNNLWSKMSKEDEFAIERALKISQIENLRNNLMSGLSGGQRQRVYVARALASEPEILILDEPFVGIDIHVQKEFYSFLKKINQERKLTIIFVSHDIDVISEEVKSVLCLNRGLWCLDSPDILHESNVIENIYGKKMTHIHHSH